jgi:hypothetical protein
MAPVLPEVSRHLQEGQADIESNTLPMARAHARLVLLAPEVQVETLFQGVPAAQHEKCLHVLDSALAQWQSELQGEVRFVRVPDGQIADVIVRFRPNVTMGNEQVAGYVNWKRSIDRSADGTINPRFTADVQIRSTNLDGSPMPSNAMRHAAIHEFGHVLGLDDSPHEGDVMGPLDIDHPVSAPSPLEVQTVLSFRAQAQRIMDEATVTP